MTLGDLKMRIIADTGRDDLEDDLADTLLAHINKAVRFYRGRNWFFLTRTTTTPTVAAQNYITRPDTLESIHRVSIPSLGYDLDRVDITCIEYEDEPDGQTGQPSLYAEGEAGTQLRLWPTPNAVFSIKITGTRRYADLAADADSNPWTNDAFDLISAHTRMTLYRDVFRDNESFMAAKGDVQDAVSALESINIDRADGPIKANW